METCRSIQRTTTEKSHKHASTENEKKEIMAGTNSVKALRILRRRVKGRRKELEKRLLETRERRKRQRNMWIEMWIAEGDL